VPTPREAPWPRPAALPAGNSVTALPAPAANLFTLPDNAAALMQPSPALSHHAEQSVPATQEAGGKARPAASGTAKADRHAGARTRVGHGAHKTRHAAHGARRSVRVASLKKR